MRFGLTGVGRALFPFTPTPEAIMNVRTVVIAICLTIGLMPVAAIGASFTFWWDINGASSGAGGATPSGTWFSGGSTWSTSSAGDIAPGAVTTSIADDAIFSASTNATGSFTVTVNGIQQIRSIT